MKLHFEYIPSIPYKLRPGLALVDLNQADMSTPCPNCHKDMYISLLHNRFVFEHEEVSVRNVINCSNCNKNWLITNSEINEVNEK